MKTVIKILSTIIFLFIFVFVSPLSIADDSTKGDSDNDGRTPAVEKAFSKPKNLKYWNLFRGASIFSVDIKTPAGRNKMSPSLKLSYSSDNPKRSLVGAGWSLPISNITRKGKRDAPPTYSADDVFYFSGNGISSPLIKTGENEYRTKHESFHKIISNIDSNSFKVINPLGTEYLFGADDESRLYKSDAASDFDHTHTWFITKIKDTNGNEINFHYEKQEDDGVIYLKQITYTDGNGVSSGQYINFIWEERPDFIISYRAGTRQIWKKRLKAIEIFSSDGVLYNKYLLEYTIGDPFKMQSKISLLTKITKIGNDGKSAMPPYEFSYTQRGMGFTENNSWLPPDSFYDRYLEDGGMRAGRVDNDGWIDFIKASRKYDCNGNISEETKKIYINNGDGTWEEREEPTLLPFKRFSVVNCFCPHDHTTDDGISFIDINGDFKTDLFKAVSSNTPDIPDVFKIYSNKNGYWEEENSSLPHTAIIRMFWSDPLDPTCPPTGDAGCPIGSSCQPSGGCAGECVDNSGAVVGACYYYPPDDCEQYRHVTDTIEAGTRLEDINGDGLPDILYYIQGSSPLIYLNQGNGSFSESSSWTLPEPFVKEVGPYHYGVDLGVKMADVNGDGLVDVLKAEEGNERKVYLNNGNGTWTYESNYSIPIYFIKKDGDHVYDNGVRLVDINQDGCVDILTNTKTYVATCSSYDSGGWIDINYDPPQHFTEDCGDCSIKVLDSMRRLIDINSDGLVDIVSSGETHLANGPYPLLLKSIKTPLGSTVSLEYTTSNRLKDSSGNYLNPDLPIILHVLTKVTVNDGLDLENSSRTTQITYSNGLIDPDTGKFMGFEKAVQTFPDSSIKEVYFIQDIGAIGEIKKIVIKDKDGNEVKKIINTYSIDDEPPYFSPLTDIDTYFTDRNGDNSTTRHTKISMSYDNYGNITKKILYGDIDREGDEKTAFNIYRHNTEKWIVKAPAISNKLYGGIVEDDDTENYINLIEFIYEGNSNWDTPPTNTKIKKKSAIGKNGETIWIENTLFDSFGNILTTRNPNGNETTYTFDEKGWKVTAITNAKGHRSEFHYNNYGNIERHIASNGIVTTFEYDVFHRLVRKKTGENGKTITYSYNNLGDPKSQYIEKRIEFDDGIYLWTKEFLNGIGKIYRIETKGTAPNGSMDIIKKFEFDEMGRPYREYLPYFRKDGPGAYIERKYDALGRLVKTKYPDGSEQTIQYNGWDVIYIDENGHKITHTKDAYNNITTITEHTSKGDFKTTYEFDAAGNIIKITDHGSENDGGGIKNETTIEWDNLNQRTRMNDPDMGEWSYEYDQAGNLTKITDSNGCITIMNYDQLNRLIEKRFEGSCEQITYKRYYDSLDGIDTGKSIGKIVKETGPKYTKIFRYDDLGRLKRKEITIDNQTRIIEYEYLKGGALHKEKIDVGSENEVTVKYIYDASGKLTSIKRTKDGSEKIILAAVKRNENNLPTSIELGNKLITKYEYYSSIKGRNRLKRQETYRVIHKNTPTLTLLWNMVSGGGSPAPAFAGSRAEKKIIQALEYGYDPKGNVTSIYDSLKDRRFYFEYDELDRLILAGTREDPIEYKYDPLGNLLERKGNYKPFGRNPTEDKYEE